MHRDKAAQHLGIGSVDNGVDSQPRDVALPDRQAAISVINGRNVAELYDSVFPDPLLQIVILYLQDAFIHLCGHADVHQGTEELPFPFCIRGRCQILVPDRIGFELFYKVI